MWWLITLLILALLAFFIVKTLMAKTQRQQSDHKLQQQERLRQSADLNQHDSTNSDTQSSATPGQTFDEDSKLGSENSELSNSTHKQSEPSSGQAADSAASASGGANSGIAAAAVASGAAAAVAGASASANTGQLGAAIDTGSSFNDVREMVKILNLEGADSIRLDISREQLTAIRNGDSQAFTNNEALSSLASRLRNMLA